MTTLSEVTYRAAICAALFLTTGCADVDDPNNRRPKVAVSFLVDLSETWHNKAADGLNQRILKVVGSSLAEASNQLPKPISVRFHAIGDASLGREPVCAATYRPSAFSLAKPSEGLIAEKAKFERYVGIDCPAMLLAMPVESSTEIVAAITTANRALQLTKKGVPKIFIVLSDFKEESPTEYSFRGTDLSNSHFVLVYRTLDEDRTSPANQRAKMRDWTQRIENLGAVVTVLDENAVLSSPKDFESLLKVAASD